MGKKRKLTEADRVRLQRMEDNARKLRALAERGQAELDRKKEEAAGS
jgi:hypothetical protein